MNLCVSIGIRIESPLPQKDCLTKAQDLMEKAREILEFEYSYFDVQCGEGEVNIILTLCYENLENENERDYLISSLQQSLIGNEFQNMVNNYFDNVSEIRVDFTGDISKEDVEAVEVDEEEIEELVDFPPMEEPKENTLENKIYDIVKEAIEGYEVYEEIDETGNPYMIIEEDTVDEIILDCYDRLYPDIEPYSEDYNNLYDTIKDAVLSALNKLQITVVDSVDKSEYEMEEI